MWVYKCPSSPLQGWSDTAANFLHHPPKFPSGIKLNNTFYWLHSFLVTLFLLSLHSFFLPNSVVLGFELRTSHMLDGCFTTWTTFPGLFLLCQTRSYAFCLGPPLDCHPSTYGFLHSWGHRHSPPCKACFCWYGSFTNSLAQAGLELQSCQFLPL
jgi:hypothetical protein